MGLMKVVKNAKTGHFEVAHGSGDSEDSGSDRIWRVVGTRNEQLQHEADDEYVVSEQSNFMIKSSFGLLFANFLSAFNRAFELTNLMSSSWDE